MNYAILLKKIGRCGIRGVPLQFFARYLTNTQHYVQMGNIVSSKQTMTCGILQESSLGPVLFLIYINDLPNCSNALAFRICADDTNVFASARDTNNKIWNFCAKSTGLKFCRVDVLQELHILIIGMMSPWQHTRYQTSTFLK